MCLGGAGSPGPVIRAVLPAAGSLWWPRALAFRFHILGDSLSAQILNSQFGTIKEKKRQRKRGKAAVSVLGEFSSGLSEIISPQTAGSLPIQPVPRHSGGGGGSPPLRHVRGHRPRAACRDSH